ncbi:hypothetical protein [Flaviaesturariibacter amylovorans]|uniref:YtxH domain-containing protein n=1 Tax=Flaviaesturariibacter amylovorans TaxID=1084520 RepID=A0ABP8GW96_9BACT
MKTTLTILAVVGAAAGIVYLLREKEPVATALKRSGDVLANAGDIIREEYEKLVKKGSDAASEMA